MNRASAFAALFILFPACAYAQESSCDSTAYDRNLIGIKAYAEANSGSFRDFTGIKMERLVDGINKLPPVSHYDGDHLLVLEDEDPNVVVGIFKEGCLIVVANMPIKNWKDILDASEKDPRDNP